jgi:hypothetical protein
MYRNIGEFEISYHKNGVKFSRVSMRSGKKATIVIGLPMMQFTVALQKWIRNEGLIQDIFPTLDADTREFIQTGITPSEWADMFEGGGAEDTELNNPEVA